MANYVVKINVNYGGLIDLFAGSGTDGNTFGSPLELDPGDTVTFQRNSIVSNKSATISGLSIFTDNSNISMNAFSSAVTRTVATGSTLSDTITGTSSDFETDNYYLKRIQAAANVTAPTASSITQNNPASNSVTATVNLSAQGSGGTLEYALAVNNNTPTNWQTSNQFTIGRGTQTVYARARRSASTNSNVVSASQQPFLLPDTSVSATSSTISTSASQASTTVSNATSGESITARLNGTTYNLNVQTANSSGQATLTFYVNLPSDGNTNTYEIFTRRPTSTGGDGSTFHATGDTFDVTRTAQDNTPESFSNFTSVTNAARSTQFTTSAQTITTITGNVAVSVSGDGSPEVSINGGAFTSSSTTIQNNQTIAVRATSSASYSTTHTATVTIGTESKTFSITTGASGGGGTSTGGGTSSYGIEIYDTDGTTTVLSPSTRYLVAMNTPGSITIAANSSHTISQDMTGLTTSNSDIFFPGFGGNFTLAISRLSNGFQLTNNQSSSITVTPVIVRF